MERINLSILVVNCKSYYPSYNWYLCKSERCFCGTTNTSDELCFNEARLKEFDSSDDYVLLPECPGMTDEEAAKVLKNWCEKNNIPYNDDIDNIEAAYRWYYKYEDGSSDYSPVYHRVNR